MQPCKVMLKIQTTYSPHLHIVLAVHLPKTKEEYKKF